ncbi:N-6 DNA methylase [Thiomicrospira microaerophila]|uniref:N-6 DNA methylase n=1 Tax=Thiomicrospira microaerophila TaxID=406020 RepID=UPI0005C9813F|nr:N-6 DNA methylase [Thiomicrospira microaerophila]
MRTNELSDIINAFKPFINENPGVSNSRFLFILSITLAAKYDNEKLHLLLSALAECNIKKFSNTLTQIYASYKMTIDDAGLPLEVKKLADRCMNIIKIIMHYAEQKKLHIIKSGLTEMIKSHYYNAHSFALNSLSSEIIDAFLDETLTDQTISIQDGAAGSGLFLSSILTSKKNVTLFLEDTFSLNLEIASAFLQLNSNSFTVQKALNNPLLGASGFSDQKKVDAYISFPQQPRKLSIQESESNHVFGWHNKAKKVSRFSSDALWVQYALSRLKANGVACIVVDDGFLQRPGYDQIVRTELIRRKQLFAVIHLDETKTKQTRYTSLSLLMLTNEKQDDDYITFIDLRNNSTALALDHSDTKSFAKCLLFNRFDKHLAHYLDKQQLRWDISIDKIQSNSCYLHLSQYLSTNLSDPPALDIVSRAYFHCYKNAKDAIDATHKLHKGIISAREK